MSDKPSERRDAWKDRYDEAMLQLRESGDRCNALAAENAELRAEDARLRHALLTTCADYNAEAVSERNALRERLDQVSASLNASAKDAERIERERAGKLYAQLQVTSDSLNDAQRQVREGQLESNALLVVVDAVREYKREQDCPIHDVTVIKLWRQAMFDALANLQAAQQRTGGESDAAE